MHEKITLDSQTDVNQVYTVAQTHTFRLIEWIELLAECLGANPNLVHIPTDVIQKADFAYAEPWPYSFTLTLDKSKAVADLGFRPTPVESWTAKTAQWYQETTQVDDSQGHADHEKEIRFAERHLALTDRLNS